MVSLAEKQQVKTKMRPRGKPWIKGQSGNPNGRPKSEVSITSIQKSYLPKPCKYRPDMTWAEYLADRGLAQAGENYQALEKLKDRVEGPVIGNQTVEITGKVLFIIGKGYDK